MEKACMFVDQCQFLIQNQDNMPKLRNLFRERYCFGPFEQCARYQVGSAVGFKNVPEYMLPSQNEWARQVIEDFHAIKMPDSISQTS